ncbi:collagen alpha-1(I) chain-like [Canis lupus familiaris]|uniref:collagen alpha-1(I) chain-like n=1 Tax=Canis lupus familiaris TaxID=9615 RepID=UPI0018F612BB|nr:collagen alpha-1(I) chain-like [Canis lupus familiaris]
MVTRGPGPLGACARRMGTHYIVRFRLQLRQRPGNGGSAPLQSSAGSEGSAAEALHHKRASARRAGSQRGPPARGHGEDGPCGSLGLFSGGSPGRGGLRALTVSAAAAWVEDTAGAKSGIHLWPRAPGEVPIPKGPPHQPLRGPPKTSPEAGWGCTGHRQAHEAQSNGAGPASTGSSARAPAPGGARPAPQDPLQAPAPGASNPPALSPADKWGGRGTHGFQRTLGPGPLLSPGAPGPPRPHSAALAAPERPKASPQLACPRGGRGGTPGPAPVPRPFSPGRGLRGARARTRPRLGSAPIGPRRPRDPAAPAARPQAARADPVHARAPLPPPAEPAPGPPGQSPRRALGLGARGGGARGRGRAALRAAASCAGRVPGPRARPGRRRRSCGDGNAGLGAATLGGLGLCRCNPTGVPVLREDRAVLGSGPDPARRGSHPGRAGSLALPPVRALARLRSQVSRRSTGGCAHAPAPLGSWPCLATGLRLPTRDSRPEGGRASRPAGHSAHGHPSPGREACAAPGLLASGSADTFPGRQDGAGGPSSSPLSPRCQLRPWPRVAGQRGFSGVAGLDGETLVGRAPFLDESAGWKSLAPLVVPGGFSQCRQVQQVSRPPAADPALSWVFRPMGTVLLLCARPELGGVLLRVRDSGRSVEMGSEADEWLPGAGQRGSGGDWGGGASGQDCRRVRRVRPVSEPGTLPRVGGLTALRRVRRSEADAGLVTSVRGPPPSVPGRSPADRALGGGLFLPMPGSCAPGHPGPQGADQQLRRCILARSAGGSP